MEIEILSFIILFLIIGVFSGLFAGLLGVGGGIITVPISYFVLLHLGYSIDVVMHMAIASSLGIILTLLIFTLVSLILISLRERK